VPGTHCGCVPVDRDFFESDPFRGFACSTTETNCYNRLVNYVIGYTRQGYELNSPRTAHLPGGVSILKNRAALRYRMSRFCSGVR
jgi:hypothetical protein